MIRSNPLEFDEYASDDRLIGETHQLLRPRVSKFGQVLIRQLSADSPSLTATNATAFRKHFVISQANPNWETQNASAFSCKPVSQLDDRMCKYKFRSGTIFARFSECVQFVATGDLWPSLMWSNCSTR